MKVGDRSVFLQKNWWVVQPRFVVASHQVGKGWKNHKA